MTSPVDTPRPSDRLRRFVESAFFDRLTIAVIIVNAITLGLETWPEAMAVAGRWLLLLDRIALIYFTIEVSLRIWSRRLSYFGDFWGWFDFLIVAVAWLPSAGPLSVLRALRILRALRLLSIVPEMRKVVGALLHALPGMGSIVAVLLLVFYVAGVMATKLFGSAFPDWFGSIGESMYSLFQIMTLESWSMGIVRPVMDVYPMAWMFFIPFIVVTSFAVLNLFIALVVNSMQTAHRETTDAVHEEGKVAHDERLQMISRMDDLTAEVTRLRQSLEKRE